MTPALLLHSANIPSSSVFDNRRFSTISFTKEEVVDMEEEKVGPTSNLDNDAAALNIVESINRLTDPSIMSQKGRLKLEVAQIIEEFGGDEFNSGLTEVQIAILTRKIAYISLFLRENRKDKHNIRSLNLMIGRRRKLLKYLIRQSRSRYFSTINALGLRDIYGDKVLKRKGARKKYPPSNLKKF
jgi:small subunit ribosomal protein S15